MSRLLQVALFAALVLFAGTALAAVPEGCDDAFRDFHQELMPQAIKSEDKHIAMAQALGAFQRCRTGDADSFDAL